MCDANSGTYETSINENEDTIVDQLSRYEIPLSVYITCVTIIFSLVILGNVLQQETCLWYVWTLLLSCVLFDACCSFYISIHDTSQ